MHIDVPEEELVRRLGGRYVCWECQAPHSVDEGSAGMKCGQCGGELYQRDDDNREAVRKRIKVYRSETLPVLDFYRQRGLLLEVPGADTVEGVNHQVLSEIGR